MWTLPSEVVIAMDDDGERGHCIWRVIVMVFTCILRYLDVLAGWNVCSKGRISELKMKIRSNTQRHSLTSQKTCIFNNTEMIKSKLSFLYRFT